MRYFLGVDVGGWKTLDMITDESGHAIGFGSAGMGNYQIVGYNGFREVLHLSVTNALAQAGIKTEEISGAGFGIAGDVTEMAVKVVLQARAAALANGAEGQSWWERHFRLSAMNGVDAAHTRN